MVIPSEILEIMFTFFIDVYLFVIYNKCNLKTKFLYHKKTHYYSNGEITVVWKPEVCIHSTISFKRLSVIFDPRRKPWIVMDNAETRQIIEQVKKCPSGALSILSSAAQDIKTEKEH